MRPWRSAVQRPPAATFRSRAAKMTFSQGECPMPQVKLVQDSEASEEVRAVFDDIRKMRNTDYVNNIWRALAAHPPVLKRFWGQMKEIMVKDSRIDSLTKEFIYLAVSITNNCEYCINSHIAAARKKGMDDATLAELVEIVALANAGNRLTQGLQVEVDERALADPIPTLALPLKGREVFWFLTFTASTFIYHLHEFTMDLETVIRE